MAYFFELDLDIACVFCVFAIACMCSMVFYFLNHVLFKTI
jgi:hypothetical protein